MHSDSRKRGLASPRIGSMPTIPPPFYSYPSVGQGMTKKKLKKNTDRKRPTVRQKQPIQRYSTSGNDTLKPKFNKNIPLSNHDLIKWCKYLNIPIKDVLSRDENIPHNCGQALFIYNLEPSYISGNHWIATYVKDNINYFDSFGMPTFQEIVNHARIKKNDFATSKRPVSEFGNNDMWLLLSLLLK